MLNTQGKDEFLGRTICRPMVKTSMKDTRTCVLQWYSLTNNKGEAGEVLASFELLLVSNQVTQDLKSPNFSKPGFCDHSTPLLPLTFS